MLRLFVVVLWCRSGVSVGGRSGGTGRRAAAMCSRVLGGTRLRTGAPRRTRLREGTQEPVHTTAGSLKNQFIEKELKNQFIWLLLRVQRRRRHLQQIETRAAVTGLHRTSAANTEVRPTTATAGVAAAELNVPRHSAPPHVVPRVTTHTHTHTHTHTRLTVLFPDYPGGPVPER